MNYLNNIITEVWHLTNEMSPYLLLGFLLAGLMHEFIPSTLYTKYLNGRNFRSVFLSALFGVPLPLCSCGVIPTAMGLHREGGSKGATISFLIATPQTGIDSIIATYSLMGLPFAIIRPFVAFVTAIFGGMMVNQVDTDEEIIVARKNEHHRHDDEEESVAKKLKEAVEYAFVEMMEDIGKWLTVGLFVAGLITALVPDAWFAVFKDNSVYSILFVLLFSIPMYLCATGSIPIAVALMLKGLTPGAALVLLMAGPASNAASILVINKVLGRKSMLVYLASIVSGAVVFGLGIDYLLPREWFTNALQELGTCCNEHLGWFSYLCTAILALLLVNALTPLKFWHGGGCHCHEHGECHCHEEEGCHCHEDEKNNEEIVHIYKVKGMNCNHCAASVKKAIESLSGVEDVDVSLGNAEARVCGNVNDEEVIKAVESIGFKVEK